MANHTIDHQGQGQSGYAAGHRVESDTYDNRMQQHGGYGRPGEGNYGARGDRPSYRGKGPANFTRSDERIKEHLSELLMDHHGIDATDVHVDVQNGELTLTGTVEDLEQRRMIEELVEGMTGIKAVHMSIKARA